MKKLLREEHTQVEQYGPPSSGWNHIPSSMAEARTQPQHIPFPDKADRWDITDPIRKVDLQALPAPIGQRAATRNLDSDTFETRASSTIGGWGSFEGILQNPPLQYASPAILSLVKIPGLDLSTLLSILLFTLGHLLHGLPREGHFPLPRRHPTRLSTGSCCDAMIQARSRISSYSSFCCIPQARKQVIMSCRADRFGLECLGRGLGRW
ncbi:hypothetical protein LIA77_06385 [Sarocladium implicatum]|nr:hypothetical protein LIA77_06385 [Sarocladium implicatum]